MCIGYNSCDFDKEENEDILYEEAIIERVNNNIEEAKIVSDIALLNKTLIEFGTIEQVQSMDHNIKVLSNTIIKDQLNIQESINSLAEKKLILLPNSINEEDFEVLNKFNTADFSEVLLSKQKHFIESEITQLEYLANITDDVDFKVFTVKVLVTLHYNLDQINKTINKHLIQ